MFLCNKTLRSYYGMYYVWTPDKRSGFGFTTCWYFNAIRCFILLATIPIVKEVFSSLRRKSDKLVEQAVVSTLQLQVFEHVQVSILRWGFTLLILYLETTYSILRWISSCRNCFADHERCNWGAFVSLVQLILRYKINHLSRLCMSLIRHITVSRFST